MRSTHFSPSGDSTSKIRNAIRECPGYGFPTKTIHLQSSSSISKTRFGWFYLGSKIFDKCWKEIMLGKNFFKIFFANLNLFSWSKRRNQSQWILSWNDAFARGAKTARASATLMKSEKSLIWGEVKIAFIS